MGNRKGNGSSKKLIDIQVKPLSRHESSASSSSSDSSSSLNLVNFHGNNDKDDNLNLEKSELIESSIPLHVPLSSSTEQFPDNHMHAEQAPAGYVPDRIPSSIFSSKPATPMELSTASNESLFSIHVGNNSFPMDQFLMLYKSGELTKLDEQIIAQGGVMPSLKELDDMVARDENIDNGFSGAKEMPTMVIRISEVAGDNGHKDGIGNHSQEMKFPAEVHNSPTSRISGLSDESTLSFAFPVLNGTGGGRLSSVNGYQNYQGLKTQSVKQQQQEQEPKPKQSTEELKPKTTVTPQNASSRSWSSWFHCCRYS